MKAKLWRTTTMAKRKTVASIEKQIQLIQQRILVAKARYERLGEQLLALNKEKSLRQAELIVDAMNRSGKSMAEIMTFLSR